jgi:hypothetical protein
MKSENYINVVQKLNSKLEEQVLSVYTLYFEYQTMGYIDYIMLSGIVVFDSENDTNIKTEDELELLLRKRVMDIINGLHLIIK